MAQKQTVRVFHSEGKNIVWPPCVALKEGDELEIYAVNTSSTVKLPMPAWLNDDTGQLATATDTAVSFKLAGGGRKKFKVRTKKELEGLKGGKALAEKHNLPRVFPYEVYCDEGKDYARGFSSPVMLIEPPNGGPGG